jgi:hypothetical protein
MRLAWSTRPCVRALNKDLIFDLRAASGFTNLRFDRINPQSCGIPLSGVNSKKLYPTPRNPVRPVEELE